MANTGYHAAGGSGCSGGARTRRRSIFVIDEARDADGDDDDDDGDSEDDGQDSFVDDRDEAELTVDSVSDAILARSHSRCSE